MTPDLTAKVAPVLAVHTVPQGDTWMCNTTVPLPIACLCGWESEPATLAIVRRAAAIAHQAAALAPVIREAQARAWDAGNRYESEWLMTWGQFSTSPHNPFRTDPKEADRG